MNWKRFDLVNNALGWLVALIAATVYLLTIGPTASLWDCAEFTACDYKLEVGHPPGAPFYMLVYNVISQLASSPAQVAWFTNVTSALLSALCILFLFWTITHMLRRLLVPTFTLSSHEGQSLTMGQAISILGGGLVGALVYTFTDTFWFSAVESEVYAFSSLFTAVVFWLIFKWDERSHLDGADRWIILIAYLVGLSIGVHLLNLLCLPAMALVYYYRRSQRPTLIGAGGAVLVSFVLIAVMMYGIVQGLPKMAGHFDKLFVNSFGCSFNSGLYCHLILLALVLVWSVWEAEQCVRSAERSTLRLRISILASVILMGIPFLGDGLGIGIVLSILIAVALLYPKQINVRFFRTVQLCLVVIALGFSSYGVILLRAEAETPMNENAPGNAFSLRYYLAREQYGAAPLLRGPSFASRPIGLKETGEVIGKAPKDDPSTPDQYTTLSTKREYEYAPSDLMLFPRVYDRGHAESYNIWMGRRADDMTPPTFGENIRFFLSYQVNYMYWRYFLWNFYGRQNDLQGNGGMLQGNPMSGIDLIDSFFLGSSEGMPDSVVGNKGHNVYYALPLLLGLLGILFQITRVYRRKETNSILSSSSTGEEQAIGMQSFWIIFMLFFMTGLAIVLYLNQYPGQPRERDYAYAGSFYAFAIWIGMGVPALMALLRRCKLSELVSACLATIIGLGISLQMAGQNWDDHDRSGQTIARDMGINYLESCEPNAVLFCYGDNDTFPLWYAQEVEGVRTDIRTINLSYLSGEWYIDQMKRASYQAAPVPMHYMKPSFYYYHEVAYLQDRQEPLSLDALLKYTVQDVDKSKEAEIVSNQSYMTVDSAQVAASIVGQDPELARRVMPVFPISLEGKSYLDRGGLATLDILLANQWKKPIYWTITSPRSGFTNLPSHQVQTGMAYQLLPVDLSDSNGNSPASVSPVRLEQMYTNVMTKFRWGGAQNPKVYLDENARNMMLGLRNNVCVPLAKALLDKGDKTRAQAVLKKCLESIRPEVVPYDYYSIRLAQVLYEAGMESRGDQVLGAIASSAIRTLRWAFAQSDTHLQALYQDGALFEALETALTSYKVATSYQREILKDYEKDLMRYSQILSPQPQGENRDTQAEASSSATDTNSSTSAEQP